MEAILLNRLSIFSKEIKCLSDKSHILCTSWNEENLETARITASKLKSILHRFNTELYQYFKVSTEPNADEISCLTSIQLEGEEMLAELETRNKDSNQATTASSAKRNFTTKLPELNLPQFTGNVLEWHQFWDQFKSNVDQRNMQDVDKLLYLKASLQGDAKTTIDGLETTNSNYKIAVSTLQKRYGKTTQVIDAHYAALYRMKRAEKQEECRKTLDDIERHLRVLESLGENTSHNHLRFLIMEKFPENIIYEMKMKINTESIEEIRKQLTVIVSAREDANRLTHERQETETETPSFTAETLHVLQQSHNRRGPNGTRKFKKRGFQPHRQNVSSFSTINGSAPEKRHFVANKENENDENLPFAKRRKLNCIFCNQSHYSDKCTEIKTLSERKLKLKDRCYNCFQLGHWTKQCRSKRKCAHCGDFGLHDRALCPKQLSENI